MRAPHAFAFAVLLLGCSSSDTTPNPAAIDGGEDTTRSDAIAESPSDVGAEAEAGADPCTGVTGKTTPIDPTTMKESDLQTAAGTALPGDVIQIGAGTLKLTNGLALTTSCVTIRGAGIDATTLDFSGQLAGSEGVLGDHVKGFTLEGLTVQDTKGDAVKVVGGDHVTFRKLKTTWTGADASKHGAYGMYPVQSKYVLIEDSVAMGASDAGIYVGQSQYVVIRRSRAEQNVAGIEIENTFDADVHDNVSTHNTAGILVFDLPGLLQLGGHDTRVFANTIKDNDTKNFAAKGDIVGLVPAGIGFLVMANHDVELFGNTIDGNQTASGAIVSYLVTQLEIKDTKYYPYPAKVSVHDNTFSNGGTSPDTNVDLGVLLAANVNNFPGKIVSDVLYDGIVDSTVTGTPPDDVMEICVHGNGGATFANLHLDKLPTGSLDLSKTMTFDGKPYDCTRAALPGVSWAGLAP